MADTNTPSHFRMYPRGFLGGNLNPQIERTPKAFGDPMAKQQYHVDNFKSGPSKIIANPYCESLYSQYIKQAVKTGSFEFRKQILLVALSSFGTNRFDEWFRIQYQSPAAGDMHNRFLLDTIKFIQTGRRDMALETWQALLLITDEGNRIGALPKEAKDFFGVSEAGVYRNPQNNMLNDVLQTWCSRHGGLEDLLGTLHILFGNP